MLPAVHDADEAIDQRRAHLTSELHRFIAIVTAQMQPERIILFGSFASGRIGRIKEWSDLDVVVVAHTDLPFYQRLDQIYRIVEPQVGLDVLVYTPEEWDDLTATRRFIREEVVEKGRMLYERPR